MSQVECFKCHKKGHLRKDCRVKGGTSDKKSDSWKKKGGSKKKIAVVDKKAEDTSKELNLITYCNGITWGTA